MNRRRTEAEDSRLLAERHADLVLAGAMPAEPQLTGALDAVRALAETPAPPLSRELAALLAGARP